jgi:hypothetical protein
VVTGRHGVHRGGEPGAGSQRLGGGTARRAEPSAVVCLAARGRCDTEANAPGSDLALPSKIRCPGLVHDANRCFSLRDVQPDVLLHGCSPNQSMRELTITGIPCHKRFPRNYVILHKFAPRIASSANVTLAAHSALTIRRKWIGGACRLPGLARRERLWAGRAVAAARRRTNRRCQSVGLPAPSSASEASIFASCTPALARSTILEAMGSLSLDPGRNRIRMHAKMNAACMASINSG